MKGVLSLYRGAEGYDVLRGCGLELSLLPFRLLYLTSALGCLFGASCCLKAFDHDLSSFGSKYHLNESQ